MRAWRHHVPHLRHLLLPGPRRHPAAALRQRRLGGGRDGRARARLARGQAGRTGGPRVARAEAHPLPALPKSQGEPRGGERGVHEAHHHAGHARGLPGGLHRPSEWDGLSFRGLGHGVRCVKAPQVLILPLFTFLQYPEESSLGLGPMRGMLSDIEW